ncbi:MAG: hypothetical protein KDJ29_15305 [Hyphomicrobiales bacterium]|nr:hypothetical protein [Hyphomicrobiales bacterium]
MRVSRLLAAGTILASAVFASSAMAAGPFDPFRAGNWKGGAYTSNSTGNFSHCAASVRYKSGIFVSVHVTRQSKWRLGFGHPNWKLTKGRIISMALTFDGIGPVKVRGLAISPRVALVPMPVNSRIIGLFRGATRMNLFADGNVFNFRLDGTSRLLPVLVQCVRRNRGF